jgi:hypothetical protein
MQTASVNWLLGARCAKASWSIILVTINGRRNWDCRYIVFAVGPDISLKVRQDDPKVRCVEPAIFRCAVTIKRRSDAVALNAIRNLVSDGVDEYCREVLVRDPRTTAWLPAFEKISGQGTKVRRARTVARILEDRAQLPEEGMGKFTKAIWKIVQGAIEIVCVKLDKSTEAQSAVGRLAV